MFRPQGKARRNKIPSPDIGGRGKLFTFTTSDSGFRPAGFSECLYFTSTTTDPNASVEPSAMLMSTNWMMTGPVMPALLRSN